MSIIFTLQNRESGYKAALAVKKLDDAVIAHEALVAVDPAYVTNSAELYAMAKGAVLVQEFRTELIAAGVQTKVVRLLDYVDALHNAHLVDDPA